MSNTPAGLLPARLRLVARYTALVLLAGGFLLPLVVALIASVKDAAELTNPLQLPRALALGNYMGAWHQVGGSVLNSVFITAPAVAASILIGAMAAYVLSEMPASSGRFVYIALVGGMLVPYQVVQIPVFLIVRGLGLYNSFPGMWLVHMTYGLPFCTFFLRNYFATVPGSMRDAAAIDGCGPVSYFVRILLPASLPGIAALAIVQTRAIWNDLFFGITITSGPEVGPVTVSLYSLVGGFDLDQGTLMAATIISFAPILVAFLAFQGAFTRGLLGGSGK